MSEPEIKPCVISARYEIERLQSEVDRRYMLRENTPYRPSSATEGDIFEMRNCTDCIYYPSGKCMKIARAMMGGQPRSWVRDENGNGVCLAKKTSRDRQAKKEPKEQIGMEL